VIQKVLEISTKVSTPIAVAGLVVGVLLILFYAILRLKIFPKLNQKMGKDLLSSMMKYVYRLAMVSIILGFVAYLTPKVLGEIFPARSAPRNYAQWENKGERSLKQAIERVAEIDRHPSVKFDCEESVLNMKVKKGIYTGSSYTDIIKQLQNSLVEPATIKYQVRLTEEGIYEIVCDQ
jgi:heme/copper-type cytochrome/quinol oxidase subunit 2